MFGTLCVPGRVRRHLRTTSLVTFLCTRAVTRLWLVRPFTCFRQWFGYMSLSLYTSRCTASAYFHVFCGFVVRLLGCVSFYFHVVLRQTNANSTPVPLFVFVSVWLHVSVSVHKPLHGFCQFFKFSVFVARRLACFIFALC